MKITLKTHGSNYSPVIDTDAMDVVLTEVFNGATLITEEGVKFAINMRDDGYEVRYWKEEEFDSGWLSFKGGEPPQQRPSPAGGYMMDERVRDSVTWTEEACINPKITMGSNRPVLCGRCAACKTRQLIIDLKAKIPKK